MKTIYQLVMLATLLLAIAPFPATAYTPSQQEAIDTLGVQEFLDHQPGPLKHYTENDLSAATIIENNSHYYGLSPRLHLVTIETVTKLLSETSVSDDVIQRPFGEAGPDGFTAQIEWFSREIRAGLGPYDEPPVLHFTDKITRELDLDQRPEIIAIQRFLAIDRTFTDWLRLKKRFNRVFEYYFESQLPDLHSHVDETEPPPDPTATPHQPAPLPEDPGASSRWSDTKYGFLHLPWPAGTRVFHLAYFDHVYPTVDSGPDSDPTVVTYKGAANVQYSGHDGHDYSFPDQLIGTPILAAAPGKAYALSYPGNGVVIEHTDGYETVYWHLHRFDARFNGLVDSGRAIWVDTGDMLGTSGMSGFTVGTPHLHFEVRHYGKQVDPYGWYGAGPDPCVAYAGCEYSVWLWHPDLLGTYDFTPPEPGSQGEGIREEDQHLLPSAQPPTPDDDSADDSSEQQRPDDTVEPVPPVASTPPDTERYHAASVSQEPPDSGETEPARDETPPVATLTINPSDDVLLHVPFDGHIVQDIGTGIPATTVAPTFDGGRYGQGIYLPPSGGLTYPVEGNLTPAAGTISLWVYLFDTYLPNPINCHYLIAASANPHDYERDYPGTLALRRDLLGPDMTPRWNFWTTSQQGTAGRHDLTAPDTLEAGWHHFAVTWEADAGTKALYIDGVLMAAAHGVDLPVDVGTVLQPGRFSENDAQSGLYFDELLIFGRLLHDHEVAALAHAAEPPRYSTTVVHSPELLFDTNASDAEGGPVAVQLGYNGVFEAPQSYYDSFRWTLPPNEGPQTLQVRYVDRAGNATTISQEVLINLAPRGSATIISRRQDEVALAIDATDAQQPISMQISTRRTFDDAPWQLLHSPVRYGLHHGDMPQLYVRFSDADGNVSAPITVQRVEFLYFPLISSQDTFS